MPSINLFADFHFIAMDKKMENDGFPSKVYAIMASAKPMIVVSSNNTPIISFLKETNAALLITEHSISVFKKAVLKLAADKNLRNLLGDNGRRIVEQKFTKQHVVNQYLKLANNI